MPKLTCFMIGLLVGTLACGIIICYLSPGGVRYTYDSRPYIKHGGDYFMLISDQPMKIKSVNVVESEGK